MKISDLFNLDAGKSKANDDYDLGDVPYVSSTTFNNGVLQFVEPYEDDKVFEGGSICVSGLGYATLQLNTFLPKGNGGDSATILIPIKDMTIVELIFYTASFNLLHTWRFSFGRKGNKTRIKDLEIPPFSEYNNKFNDEFEDLMKVFKTEIKHFGQILDTKPKKKASR
ncbi:MAG: hypothetical protein A2275_02565 [Bacteroidetes bacterium RIFOXYA12_FULL_35_11]|nr:MAG: hypothetical protein A2X01_15165 [Bacteroidetes bacterium GWF2_35_48]OFY72852.1 MAG: hypothetical protein A2275_02565 [Bacteroidetes bacterium RIFOXYA12_FULL_35_11]OFY92814.1 MAG: hypothetical protein A2309_02215 [Bacteroidetes bacterium RIFOXYB2_FULL_35_7]HBX53086.1 hypothetical protein [Bacteroidales bacterium]